MDALCHECATQRSPDTDWHHLVRPPAHAPTHHILASPPLQRPDPSTPALFPTQAPLAFLWRSCLFSGKQRDAIASICILLYTFCAAYICKYKVLMRYGIGTHPGAGTGSVFQD